MKTIKHRVILTIAETLQLNEADIAVLDADAGYKQVTRWNSARHAEVIVAIEDEFDMEFDELSIPRMSTVPRIVEYLEAA